MAISIEMREGEGLFTDDGRMAFFISPTRLIIQPEIKFLRGRYIRHARDAGSPARRLYLAIQYVFVGYPQGCDFSKIQDDIDFLEKNNATRELLLIATGYAKANSYFQALKTLRELIVVEDEQKAARTMTAHLEMPGKAKRPAHSFKPSQKATRYYHPWTFPVTCKPAAR